MNVKTMSFSRIRKGVLLRTFYKEKGMGGDTHSPFNYSVSNLTGYASVGSSLPRS